MLTIGTNAEGTILDYFAGSGTTGHAVINLNRADGGKRKYILVEMGEYFDTVTKPRIQKVIYSADWKDGKPVSRAGSSHMFKYLRLESYEDTLNNVRIQRPAAQQMLLEDYPQLHAEYLLGYMLDVETRDSASLLTKQAFTQPFGYTLDIASGGSVAESTPTTVDLVETFNYLIGLRVSRMHAHGDLRTVQGTTPDGKRTLVVWRDVANVDDQALWRTLHDGGYDLTAGYDVVYVNGDCTLGGRVGSACQVRLIDAEFHDRMFADAAL
jgi:adenine-specific DNA-methyltransferase